MKRKISVLPVILGLMLFSAPASADSVLQIWACTLNDGYTGEDVVSASSDWLKAAKATDGGADLAVYIDFPIAANAGDDDFNFVLVAADTATWGKWYGGDDEAMQAANLAWSEVAACKRASMWMSIEVK